MSELIGTDLSISYGDIPVVHQADIRIEAGEFVILVGPNGAGKTSLLKALAGLLPYDGSVELDQIDLRTIKDRERAKQIAWAPQSAPVHWPLTVKHIVALGRIPHLGPFDRLSSADEAAIKRAMDLADCSQFKDRLADEVSGGERARIMLARALAVEAPIVMADEPTASLDPAHAIRTMDILKAQALAGAGVLAVLHDLALAARYADRVILMDQGKIIDDGPAESVLSADNLASVYGVKALSGIEAGEPWILPWQIL